MSHGKFIVIDGLDAVGKDTLISGVAAHIQAKGQEIFDITKYWKEHAEHPRLTGQEADVYLAAEPTYVGAGKFLRETVLPENGIQFTAAETAQLYAIDRHDHLQRNILPALANGKTVFQSRSYISSLVYQPMMGDTQLTIDEVLALDGNAFAQRHAPDVMLIPTIQDMNELERRLGNEDRGEADQFENLAFQKKIKPVFEGQQLKDYLASVGTKPIYFDVGVPKEPAVHNAIQAYEQALAHLQK